MIARRGILAAILGAPAMAVASRIDAPSQGIERLQVAQASGRITPRPGRDLFQKLEAELETAGWQEFIPPHIANKKSWSDQFKYSAAKAEHQRRRSLHRRLQDIWYGDELDPITTLSELRKLAEEMRGKGHG